MTEYPFLDLASPVIWRPRHFNQLADELANRAMDIGEDFEWFCDTSTNWNNSDLIICSDGGFRAKGKSASVAWIIIDRPDNITMGENILGSGNILAKGAKFLQAACQSSFMAEAIALEEAINVIVNRRRGPHSVNNGISFTFETATYRRVTRYS